MRIIHLSDIHLSSDNIEVLRLHYLNSLVEDLKKINREKEIDLIIISGDLVDKGGNSLLSLVEHAPLTNPYDIFEKEFITPICEKLPIIKDKFLFIAGNHDIERNKIHEFIESGLKTKCTTPKNINDFCSKYSHKLNYLNFERIEKFHEFEKNYHSNKYFTYNFSEFESKVIYNYNDQKIGIALINDSWRCSDGEIKDHFVGTNQFHKSLNFFKDNDTCFNIAVMHHPLECFNAHEKDEIENILCNLNFQMLLIGHDHKKRVFENNFGNDKKILFSRGRTAFDKPHEQDPEYAPGYSIIDIEFDKKEIECSFMKYYKSTYKFDIDLENGKSKAKFKFGIDGTTLKKINTSKENFVLEFKKEDFIYSSENEE